MPRFHICKSKEFLKHIKLRIYCLFASLDELPAYFRDLHSLRRPLFREKSTKTTICCRAICNFCVILPWTTILKYWQQITLFKSDVPKKNVIKSICPSNDHIQNDPNQLSIWYSNQGARDISVWMWKMHNVAAGYHSKRSPKYLQAFRECILHFHWLFISNQTIVIIEVTSMVSWSGKCTNVYPNCSSI